MAEPQVRGLQPTPRPIGMGSYQMDSHNTQRIVDAKDHVRNEGNIEVAVGHAHPKLRCYRVETYGGQ